jgi:ABC-2 type transport system permease protein
MDAALKRMMPGFLRNLGIYTPPASGYNPMMGQMGGGGGKQFRALQKKLEQSYSIKAVDLDSGVVPSDVDVLLVLAPHEFHDKQIFAVDQFLMKGGSVILASSPVSVTRDSRSFSAEAKESGLEKWLASYGVDIPKELVLDKSNVGFPTIRKRSVQGVTIREPHIAPYPFFVDVREKGLNRENAISSGLAQVTVAWPSPVLVNADLNKDRKVTTLVESSARSWRTSDINIDPNPSYELGFAEGTDQKSIPLAVLMEGHFESYFKGKASPLLQKADDKEEHKDPRKQKEENKPEDKVYGVIERSPNVARLVVFGSNEFVSDDTIQVVGMLNGTQYTNPLQLIENAVDWSVQDRTLLAIRSHGHFARTLHPLTDSQKQGWELFNYIFAFFGLLTVWGAFRYTQRRSRRLYKSLNLV